MTTTPPLNPHPDYRPDAQPSLSPAPIPTISPPAAPPALHGYDPVKIAGSLPSSVAMPATVAPDYSTVTDIVVPDINDVKLQDFSEFRSKLEVIDPDPMLEYRWVNSDVQRMQQLFHSGYRVVQNKERANSDVAGSDTPRLMAGTDANGAGRHAILVARPKAFREMRDASYRDLIRNNQLALDPKRHSSVNGTVAGDNIQAALKMGTS